MMQNNYEPTASGFSSNYIEDAINLSSSNMFKL